jgi:hypothetical protein
MLQILFIKTNELKHQPDKLDEAILQEESDED